MSSLEISQSLFTCQQFLEENTKKGRRERKGKRGKMQEKLENNRKTYSVYFEWRNALKILGKTITFSERVTFQQLGEMWFDARMDSELWLILDEK